MLKTKQLTEEALMKKFKGREFPAEHDTELKKVGSWQKGRDNSFKGYRYTIKGKLNTYFDIEGRRKFKEKICELTGITERSYTTYINIAKDDTKDIPGVVLFHIADLLKCPINELFNGRPTI